MGVYGDGLIARIGAQDMDAATAQPGVRPFDMTGRPMRGIVVIDSAVLDDKALDRWIGQARRYVAGLPPKWPSLLQSQPAAATTPADRRAECGMSAHLCGTAIMNIPACRTKAWTSHIERFKRWAA